MSFEELLIHTVDIKQVTGYAYGKAVHSTLHSNVDARVEESSRFVRDKNGSEVLANYFIFLPISIPLLKVDWIVTFMGVDYEVLKVDRIPDAITWHHWEAYLK